MKKLVSLALAGITAASVLASCAPAKDRLDSSITLASSDAAEYAQWLDSRLDAYPTDVVVGIGSNETYGIDMSDFEEDGYILRSFGKDTLVFGASADGLDRAVRAYAKAADAGSVETLDVTYHEGARIKKLTIAGRDISEYTVVYNHDRDSVQPKAYVKTLGNAMYAAEELVRLIELATGITLTAVPHTEKVDGPVISIDYYTEGDLGKNGFTYEVKDGNLYINGVGQANGCANAVYYLLEHECGWESLIYGDSVLWEADLIDLPNGLAKRIKPMFRQIRWYEMYALLDKALKLCCDTKQEERVKRLMCDVLYRECAYEYFPAYDAEDYETIADLEKKYDLFVEYLSECGYDFSKDAVHGVYTFGPCVSSGAFPNPFYRKSLESNLTDAMWINLQQYRDALTPEGTVQRPVPDGYEPYVSEQ